MLSLVVIKVLKQTWGCLQPSQKGLHELLVQLCTTAPSSEAAVLVPVVAHRAQSSPGRAPLRHEVFTRDVNGGPRMADLLVMVNRQRGQRMSVAAAFLSSL